VWREATGRQKRDTILHIIERLTSQSKEGGGESHFWLTYQEKGRGGGGGTGKK